MPYVPLDFAQVLARISLSGDPDELAVTFGVGVVGVLPFDQVDADNLSNRVATFLKNTMSNAYNYVGAHITVGKVAGGDIWDSVTGAGSGTNGASSIPQNSAYLFSKRTSRGGRKGRGRMYVPGVSEALVGNSGVVDATEVGNLQSRANAFLNGLAIDLTPMYLLHSSVGDGAPDIVNTMAPSGMIATQRRRLR